MYSIKNFLKPTRVTWAIFLFIVISQLVFTFIPLPYNSIASYALGYLVKAFIVFSLSVYLTFSSIALFLGEFFKNYDAIVALVVVPASLIILLSLIYLFASVISFLWYKFYSRKLVYGTLIVILLIITGSVGASYYQTRNDQDYKLLKIDEKSCYLSLWRSADLFFQRNSNLPRINQDLVINTQEDYQKLTQYRIKGCDMPLPEVDFSKSTVLGKYATGSCAAYDFKRRYGRDDSNKTAYYSVTPLDRFLLSCSGPGYHSMNLIEVPKIPTDYKIIFSPKAQNQKDYKSYRADPSNPGGWIEEDYYGNVTRKGTGAATSSSHVQFEGFSNCFTKEVADLMRKNGATGELRICQ